MTLDSGTLLTLDLIARVEREVGRVCHLAVATDITFKISDVVAAVEQNLPPGYPAPTQGEFTRTDIIERMAQEIFSGEMYASR